MRALVSEGVERLALLEVATPRPGPGEVLVRVLVALTCATDFKLLRRGHPKFPFPLTLGHEFAGVVEAAGPGASFSPGERVTSAVSGPCGLCEDCRAGRENLCATAFERPLFGAFADFLLVPESIVKNGLRRIPPGLSDEAAALLDPLASIVHALNRVSLPDGGDVLIVGTGPIAAMMFFLLRGKTGGREREGEGAERGGARRIVVAGRRPERLAFFEGMKAEVAQIAGPSRLRAAGDRPPHPTFKESETVPLRIDPSSRDPLADAAPSHSTFEENAPSPSHRSLSSRDEGAAAPLLFSFKENEPVSSGIESRRGEGAGFSLVIDTTGDAGVIAELPAFAANRGTVLLFAGMPEGARLSVDAFAVHYREVSFTGSFHYTPRDVDAALGLLAAGAIPAGALVEERRGLAEWREAFELVERGAAMKVALVP